MRLISSCKDSIWETGGSSYVKDRMSFIRFKGILCDGKEALIRVINHPRLRELPFYLETPNELSGYAEEIAMLRAAYIEE